MPDLRRAGRTFAGQPCGREYEIGRRIGKPTKPHTKAWAQTIGSDDGFVFVTPEYNHIGATRPR